MALIWLLIFVLTCLFGMFLVAWASAVPGIGEGALRGVFGHARPGMDRHSGMLLMTPVSLTFIALCLWVWDLSDEAAARPRFNALAKKSLMRNHGKDERLGFAGLPSVDPSLGGAPMPSLHTHVGSGRVPLRFLRMFSTYSSTLYTFDYFIGAAILLGLHRVPGRSYWFRLLLPPLFIVLETLALDSSRVLTLLSVDSILSASSHVLITVMVDGFSVLFKTIHKRNDSRTARTRLAQQLLRDIDSDIRANHRNIIQIAL